MLIVVTYDENGGHWDHVAPPKGDRWGPGTRIPAIIISPFAKQRLRRPHAVRHRLDRCASSRTAGRCRCCPAWQLRDAALERASAWPRWATLTSARPRACARTDDHAPRTRWAEPRRVTGRRRRGDRRADRAGRARYGERPSVARSRRWARAMFNDLACRPTAGWPARPATIRRPRSARTPDARARLRMAIPRTPGARAIPSLRYAQFAAASPSTPPTTRRPTAPTAAPRAASPGTAAPTPRASRRAAAVRRARDGQRRRRRLAHRVAAAPLRRAVPARRSARPAATSSTIRGQVVDWVALALEVFEQAPAVRAVRQPLRPLAGRPRRTLSPAELRGLALPRPRPRATATRAIRAGAAAAAVRRCSPMAGFVALAVPRRAGLPPPAAIAAAVAAAGARRRAPTWACAARGARVFRHDPASAAVSARRRCATWRIRTSFFHNGSIRSLREAVAFYATRDTDPGTLVFEECRRQRAPTMTCRRR